MSAELLQTAHHLADLLTTENAALRRLDFPAAVALTPAKEVVLADLTRQSEGRSLTPPLIALGKRLAALADENQVLLGRAIEVQTRIVRIVARACTPAPGVTRYGVHGKRSPSNRAAALALSTRA